MSVIFFIASSFHIPASLGIGRQPKIVFDILLNIEILPRNCDRLRMVIVSSIEAPSLESLKAGLEAKSWE